MSLDGAPILLAQNNAIGTPGEPAPVRASEGQAPPDAAGGGAPGPQQQPDMTGSLLMMVGIFALFYFIAIRPQQKQAKEHKKLVESLRVGDQVVTSSGILGRIHRLEDRVCTLEVDKNTRLRILRDHVQTRQDAGASAPDKK